MLVISIAAVAIGLVAVVALVLVSGGLGSDEATDTVSQPEAKGPAQELRQGRTLVQPDTIPPVVVEAYEDPQCGHCGTFTERIEPLLIAEHVTDGTASFTYKDFIIFSEESLDAAIAMRVAEDMDGKFWDLHQIIFHNQQGVEDGSFSRSRLADMAELVGLDRDEFLSRMDESEFREAVLAERAEGEALGIASTPTVIVNGELLVGVPTWEDLDAAITEAAQAAQA